MPDDHTTESMLTETRRFAPPAEFAAQAHVKSIAEYEALHARSIAEPEAFWAEVAADLHWFKPWDTVESESVEEGPDGGPAVLKLTYNDLLERVSRFANVLKSKGVKKGDVVTIYMGMVPELAVAMLACARIGAVHSIIFGGFSAQAIRDRVEDGDSKLLVTCDGSWRRGKVVPLKGNVDEALTMTDRVKDVIVSGSTGKPKGIMHTTGGYMVHSYMTSKLSFDLKADDPNELYWCTADLGWITGHSYIIYGLLPNRCATMMFEGGVEPQGLGHRGRADQP